MTFPPHPWARQMDALERRAGESEESRLSALHYIIGAAEERGIRVHDAHFAEDGTTVVLVLDRSTYAEFLDPPAED